MTTIAASLGLSLGSGWSLYGVICWMAIFHELKQVDLPGRLETMTEPPWFIGIVLMALIEFVVDKRRGLDILWDAIHLFLRVPGGALLAFLATENIPLTLRGFATLLGGGLAFSAHSTKASLRLTTNAFSDSRISLVLSFVENVHVAILVGLVLFKPHGALAAIALISLGMAFYLPRVVGAFFVALNRTLTHLLARTR